MRGQEPSAPEARASIEETQRVVRRAIGAILVLGTLVVSCGGGHAQTIRAGQPPGTSSVAGATAGKSVPFFPAVGVLLGTPIYSGNFADPAAIAVGDRVYVYATNTAREHVPVLMVEGSTKAELVGDAFPKLPAWSTPGFVWAPAVFAAPNHYVLYVSTLLAGTSTQCIARAVSTSPTGPFVDDESQPFLCQRELGGTIDPSVVVDREGRPWLLFKSDGNCCGLPTAIWSQQLSADGMQLVGPRHKLIEATQKWEGGLVEGPSMVVGERSYFLFYSGNDWARPSYGISYAVCDSVAGPCRKPRSSAWLTSTAFARGPGGQEFVTTDGRTWMIYHGWPPFRAGDRSAPRQLFLDQLAIEDGTPQLVGSTTGLNIIVIGSGAVAALVAVAVMIMVVRKERRSRSGARPPTDAEPLAAASR